MSSVLDQFTTEELQALQSGDLSSIPTEKLRLLQSAMPAPAAPAPASSQNIRTFLQGATMKASDEIEAFLRSAVTGQPAGPIRQEIRGQIKAFQQENPVRALALEAGGAFVPALAAAPFTGGTSLALTLPSVARVAGLSGLQGGITGFNTAEGGVLERLPSAAQGAATGAVAGPATEAIVRGAGVPFNALLDVARRQFGGRGAKAVETEVQRLVQTSGLTPDEIVARIARGEIMAENVTLQQSVRAMYTAGGEGASEIARVLGPRAATLRTQAQGQLQRGLAPDTTGNVLRQAKLDEEQFKDLVGSMYDEAYDTGAIVTQPLLDSFATAAKRSPKAASEISEYYTLATGKSPFFKFKSDGDVEFGSMPTIKDMEIVRRGLQEQVDNAFSTNRTTTGGAFKDLERALRTEIDRASPALAQARATASTMIASRKSFKEGQKVFNKTADQVEVDLEDMNPEQLTVFRAGAMDALRNKMTSGSRKSMMGNLADESSKEGRILRSIFPQDQLDSMLGTIGVAAQSQQARNRIMGGSDTASSMLRERQIGSNISAAEVSEVLTTGNPFAALRLGTKLVAQNTQNLSDAQRLQVARILTASDPDVVRRALTDESAMAALQQQIRALGNQLATGTRGAAAGIAGSRFSATRQ